MHWSITCRAWCIGPATAFIFSRHHRAFKEPIHTIQLGRDAAWSVAQRQPHSPTCRCIGLRAVQKHRIVQGDMPSTEYIIYNLSMVLSI